MRAGWLMEQGFTAGASVPAVFFPQIALGMMSIIRAVCGPFDGDQIHSLRCQSRKGPEQLPLCGNASAPESLKFFAEQKMRPYYIEENDARQLLRQPS
jgi:hypothetical protein